MTKIGRNEATRAGEAGILTMRRQHLVGVLLLLLQISAIAARPYILFANRKDIRLLELTDNKKRAATNIIVKGLEDAAALDYLLEESKVCWSEINRELIRSDSTENQNEAGSDNAKPAEPEAFFEIFLCL